MRLRSLSHCLKPNYPRPNARHNTNHNQRPKIGSEKISKIATNRNAQAGDTPFHKADFQIRNSDFAGEKTFELLHISTLTGIFYIVSSRDLQIENAA